MATVVELAPQPEQGDERRDRARVAFSGVPADERAAPSDQQRAATSAGFLAPVKGELLSITKLVHMCFIQR